MQLEEPPDDGGAGPDGEPARAWIRQAPTPSFTGGWFSAGRPIPWLMTLERGGETTSHEASLEQLVYLAQRSGVRDVRVWDPGLEDFRALGPEDVRLLAE
ncbi:hypothetical protein ACFP3Q_09730 [Nocardioides sp. GCM10027113]|uniref:hypothetical protein n=1 Tax=unclassified Nocardioides TaxID=2615069 RepID=UPI00362316CD